MIAHATEMSIVWFYEVIIYRFDQLPWDIRSMSCVDAAMIFGSQILDLWQQSVLRADWKVLVIDYLRWLSSHTYHSMVSLDLHALKPVDMIWNFDDTNVRLTSIESVLNVTSIVLHENTHRLWHNSRSCNSHTVVAVGWLTVWERVVFVVLRLPG